MECEVDAEKIKRVIPVSMVSTSISRQGGGVTPVMQSASRALVKTGTVSVNVYALRDGFSLEDVAGWSGIPTNCFDSFGPKAFGYSPSLLRAVRASNAKILHRHGLWNFPSHAVSRAAGLNRKPYVVSVHGMLNPQALKVASFKKRIMGRLFEKRFLQRADCIHALGESEI
ncbi:MAG: glycosyltransferase, partial [Planctomycetaceae bacterium]|nr:glycosyltransferase [Planctomycetaceae bacterium]